MAGHTRRFVAGKQRRSTPRESSARKSLSGQGYIIGTPGGNMQTLALAVDPGPPLRQVPVPQVEVEDGTAFATSAWQKLLLDRNVLQTPDLTITALPEFMAEAEAQSHLSTEDKLLV